MKSIFNVLKYALLIIGTIVHLWTVIIAFSEGGVLSGLISIFLPFIAEIYWMVKMWGENDIYAYCSLFVVIIYIPYPLLSGNNN